MKITPETFTADMLCMESFPDPCGMVIFGASGDLTRRKLLPALAHLRRRKLLPARFFLAGLGRSPLDDGGFRGEVRAAFGDAAAGPEADELCAAAFYATIHYDDPEAYAALARRLAGYSSRFQTRGNLLFYLATPPDLCAGIVRRLAEAGLLHETAGGGWRRVVFEKPFGHDRSSARTLNEALRRHLAETQTYRIDHYLGKDTVQNIFMLRFANLIFEPVWNRNYIEHVQITAAETVGVEHRAGYYERTGALRDMFQNHLLQLLALTAMEAPGKFDAARVLAEKNKVLHSLVPFDGPENIRQNWVRGQYAAAAAVPAYRNETGIAPDSMTETYAAGVFHIDNWRWAGVPFCLRSGKRLARRLTEIVITFKPVPMSVFPALRAEDLARNVLVLNVQPDEGVALTIQAKRPGPKLCMSALTLDFQYREVFKADPPDAYERLLLDAMLGDQTLFTPTEFIDLAWAALDPVAAAWADPQHREGLPLHPYAAGSWGPAAADALLRPEGRAWHNGVTG